MFSFAVIFAGGKKDAPKTQTKNLEVVRIGLLSGPSGIPCAKLLSDSENNFAFPTIEHQVFASAMQLLPKIISGEIDIGFLPPNVAAKAYNSGNAVLVNVGVSGNGMISLITKDDSIRSILNLRGKTVAVAGAGATPEYVFKTILLNESQDSNFFESVILDFSIPNNQIAAAVISGTVDAAIVPEPFATLAQMQDSEVKRVVDIQEAFAKAGGFYDYPMTLIVASAKFAKENPQFIAQFQTEYQKAQNWTKENPKEAGELSEKYALGLKSAVVQNAIPNLAYTFALPFDSKAQVENLLNVFLRFAPEAVGGKLPADDFYFKIPDGADF